MECEWCLVLLQTWIVFTAHFSCCSVRLRGLGVTRSVLTDQRNKSLPLYDPVARTLKPLPQLLQVH